MSVARRFKANFGAAVTAGATSAATALAGGGPNVELANAGPSRVHFVFGDGPTATLAHPFLMPGERVRRQIGGEDVALITPGGSAVVSIEAGTDGDGA